MISNLYTLQNSSINQQLLDVLNQYYVAEKLTFKMVHLVHFNSFDLLRVFENWNHMVHEKLPVVNFLVSYAILKYSKVDIDIYLRYSEGMSPLGRGCFSEKIVISPRSWLQSSYENILSMFLSKFSKIDRLQWRYDYFLTYFKGS